MHYSFWSSTPISSVTHMLWLSGWFQRLSVLLHPSLKTRHLTHHSHTLLAHSETLRKLRFLFF